MECLKKLNYYERLGIDRTSNQDEIRHAFRTLAQNMHPDAINGSDSKEKVEFFKLITEAYNTLIDQKKREKYDSNLIALEEKRRAKTILIDRENLLTKSTPKLNQLKSSPVPSIRYKAEPPILRHSKEKKLKRRRRSRKRKNTLSLAYNGLLRLLGLGIY